MGLAGTKRKQRLVGSATTRNSTWANDESLPGQRLMAQMGWSQGQGIGLSDAARTENIKAMFKMDNKGIGAQRAEREARASGSTPSNDKWIGGGGELGGLFERLNASASVTPAVTPDVVSEDEGEGSKSSKKRKRGDDDTKSKKSRSSKDEKRAAKEEKRRMKEEKKAAKSKSKSKSKSTSTSSSSEGEVEESTTAQPLASTSTAAMVIRNASRAKYLRAKRQLYGDHASMNEILGIKAESSGTSTPTTDVQSAIEAVVAAQEEEAASEVPALTDKELKKADKKRAKEERKEEKKRDKKAKRKEDKEKDEPVTEDTQPEVQNTVSPYSVHEYLSRRLMLRKAQVMKQKRLEGDVWGRQASMGVGLGAGVEVV